MKPIVRKAMYNIPTPTISVGNVCLACQGRCSGTAKGRTYVTASAGNHGMSVAAGAAAFGARAVVYIAETVPEAFAKRLRETGAEVRRERTLTNAPADSPQSAARSKIPLGLQSDMSQPPRAEQHARGQR